MPHTGAREASGPISKTRQSASNNPHTLCGTVRGSTHSGVEIDACLTYFGTGQETSEKHGPHMKDGTPHWVMRVYYMSGLRDVSRAGQIGKKLSAHCAACAQLQAGCWVRCTTRRRSLQRLAADWVPHIHLQRSEVMLCRVGGTQPHNALTPKRFHPPPKQGHTRHATNHVLAPTTATSTGTTPPCTIILEKRG